MLEARKRGYKFNAALAFDDQELIAALTVHTTEQNEEPCQLTWPAFLAILENYCRARDWTLEYGHETDGSCAIFALEDTLPAAFSEEKEDEAEKQCNEW